jgi:hypothetical protein
MDVWALRAIGEGEPFVKVAPCARGRARRVSRSAKKLQPGEGVRDK